MGIKALLAHMKDWIVVPVKGLYSIVAEIMRAMFGPKKKLNQPTLYVKGRELFDNAGNKIILRGVNLPLLDDWDFPKSDRLAEIEKTGANAIRIQWYVTYPRKPEDPVRPLFATAHLDTFLAKCKAARIIPIVTLFDYTCSPDTTLVNSGLVPWWTRAEVVAMLNAHKRYVIINIGNEVGHYRWLGSTAAALTAYRNAYASAITSIRNTGLAMPIMIDAPDCGTSLNAFNSIGQALVDHDPKHNILLSVHAYWAAPGFDGPAEIRKAHSANLPIVFGEIANKQADHEDECFYALDGGQGQPPANGFKYQDLLALLKTHEMGWLAWSWWRDKCPAREMTTNGTFAGLTPYGSDIVNNVSYGLKATAKRSPTLP